MGSLCLGLDDGRMTASQFRTTFRLMDLDDDGKLTPDELAEMFRKLKQGVTEEELQLMITEVTGETDATSIDFNSFMDMLSESLSEKEPDDVMLEAYNVFKGEQESITAEQLRAILEEFGEPLKDAEFAELLKGVELGP